VNIQTPVRVTAAEQAAKLRVIDCDVHPVLRAPSDLRRYLPRGWQEHFDSFGQNLRQPFAGGDPYPKLQPYLSRRDSMPPAGGPPGSDLAFMQEQLLDAQNVEYGILQVISPSGSNQRNIDFGAAMCSALNDWQIETWTGPEPRLKGSLVVTADNPDAAVAELKRSGPKADFAQFSVPQRCMEPQGRRRYWPIYAAAVDQGLPLGIHTGGLNGHGPTPGSGWCSYYVEQHQVITLAMQTIITSMIMEGVFEEFRDLKVLLIEGGFTWVPAFAWRLDSLWRRLKAEVPRVKRPPSEYIREHFWFSSQPIGDWENPDDLKVTLDWLGWDRLVYSSDYPHWDFDDIRTAFPLRFDAEQRQQLLNGNARRFLRLN
jgi:predicted TIM-barrel fold metal-dependent hydrolase